MGTSHHIRRMIEEHTPLTRYLSSGTKGKRKKSPKEARHTPARCARGVFADEKLNKLTESRDRPSNAHRHRESATYC